MQTKILPNERKEVTHEFSSKKRDIVAGNSGYISQSWDLIGNAVESSQPSIR